MFPCPLHLPMVHHLTTTQKRPRKNAHSKIPTRMMTTAAAELATAAKGEVGQLNGAMRDVWDMGVVEKKDARTHAQARTTRERGRLTGEATVTVYQCFGNKNTTKKII